MVDRVKPVLARPQAAGPRRATSGGWLLGTGAVAFGLAIALYAVYAGIHPTNWTLDPVDLGVYRSGGLIVRHVRPVFDPRVAAPLYDWGGYSSLGLKFTYTPFAAIVFAVVSFIPWSVLPKLSVGVNIAALVAALWLHLRRPRLPRPALGAPRRDAAGRRRGVLDRAGAPDPVPRPGQPGADGADHAGICASRTRRPAAGGRAPGSASRPASSWCRSSSSRTCCSRGSSGRPPWPPPVSRVTVLLGFLIQGSDSSKWWFGGLFFQGGRTGFTGWEGNQSLRGLLTRLAGSVDRRSGRCGSSRPC